jgi:hypothetical protein
MKPSSILLRVLLCVALVLNGIGTAMASARMLGFATVVSTEAARVIAPAQHAHGGCHEHAGAMASHDEAAKPVAHHGKHGADCCEAGLCACHCAQQAQMAFVPPVLASPQVARSASVQALSSAHLPPRLPPLIRPPIFPAT